MICSNSVKIRYVCISFSHLYVILTLAAAITWLSFCPALALTGLLLTVTSLAGGAIFKEVVWVVVVIVLLLLVVMSFAVKAIDTEEVRININIVMKNRLAEIMLYCKGREERLYQASKSIKRYWLFFASKMTLSFFLGYLPPHHWSLYTSLPFIQVDWLIYRTRYIY